VTGRNDKLHSVQLYGINSEGFTSPLARLGPPPYVVLTVTVKLDNPQRNRSCATDRMGQI